MKTPVQVIVFPVGESARIEAVDVGRDGLALKALQKIVGDGFIERVPNSYWDRPAGSRLDLFCNEDGIAKGLPRQERPEIGLKAPLCGNLVLARSDDEGTILSVTGADIALYVRPAPSSKAVPR